MVIDFHRLIVEETSDAFIALSADGCVLLWNQGAEQTFGYSADEAVGQPLASLIVPAEHLDAHHAAHEDVLASGSKTYRAVRRKKDRSLIELDLSARVVNDVRGYARYFILNKPDVAERVRLERELRERP